MAPPPAELIHERDVAGLRSWLAETGILEIAEQIERLDPAEGAVAIRLLPRDRALAVFEELSPTDQQQLLEGLREDRVRQLVEDMDPDDRAKLVDELPAKMALRLLGQLSTHERQLTNELLGYPQKSAGRAMTPEFVSLRASMTVGEALAKVQRTGSDAETIYTLPVTDDQRHLVGVISLRDLVLWPRDVLIGDLLEREFHQAHVQDDQEGAARLIQEANLLALPVLDSDDRLVGMITVDDAMEILEAEETEDLALHGASQPLGRPYMSASVFGLARARVVWLMVLVIAAALTVNVMQYFETTLETVVTLALFIPMLMNTGGNSGTQAATAVIRAMAVGEVRFGDLAHVVWREARVGMMLGAMLSVVAFIPVTVLFDSDIATVVSLTIVTVCSWATFIGAAMPMLARRAGVDPAVVSAPFITTLVDATGLVIYFLIAQAVLGL
jgi:magnesium transporter